MSLPGPKPKPTHLKVLEGNPGKRRLNHAEPKPTPKAPTCPAWLSKEAKAEWKRVVPELTKIGMLTVVDRAALVAYCEAWAQHRTACEVVNRDGIVVQTRNGLVKNPALQIVRDSASTIAKFCAEFGLTPSARSRLTLPEPSDDDIHDLLN